MIDGNNKGQSSRYLEEESEDKRKASRERAARTGFPAKLDHYSQARTLRWEMTGSQYQTLHSLTY